LDNSVLSRFASPKSYLAVTQYLSNRSSLPWTIPATVAYEYYSYFDTQEEVRIQQTKLDTHFDGILPVTDDEIQALGDELRLAEDEGRTQHELVVVQNEDQNELTVLSNLREGDMEIDRVHIVKLEEVID